MSETATSATQNDRTTCVETFEKDRFASFPHRHGDATGKPETRDRTRGCRNNSISYETSSNFHIFNTLSNRLECHKVSRLPRQTTGQPAWKHSKRICFPASPIDTATPQENQRLETRHVDTEKPAFRTRLPPILTLCSFTIDVFRRVFLRTRKLATSKSMFRARLPSIFSTSHKMPRLPRNLHLVATWRSPANAIYKNTQHDTSKVLRLPRKMTMDTSKVLRLPRKLQHIFWKRHKSIAPATQNDFRHVAEHVWMSRSATPATRNEATTRLKPPKMTTSAELPIGTAIRSSYERLRTVADADATSSEHTFNPQTPRVKREPLLRIRENYIYIYYTYMFIFPLRQARRICPSGHRMRPASACRAQWISKSADPTDRSSSLGHQKRMKSDVHFSTLFYILSFTFLYFSILYHWLFYTFLSIRRWLYTY